MDDEPIAALRRQHLGRAYGTDEFVPSDLDAERDRAGLLFCAEQYGELLASILALPYETGLGEVACLGGPLCERAHLDNTCLEVCRFVALKAAGPRLMRESARWCLQNTGYRRLYALVPVSLVRYYRALGLTIEAEDVAWEGASVPRRFVHGKLTDIVSALAYLA
ncbi:hypothetical protein [Streptomyces sp. NPDC056661]|uniref:hypothetical protein n=1 Tax=Streptomyces sp. NPDC056661 TaxID=3345898 RepID=UPI0036BB2F0D